jgi:hypothetical protein
MAAKLQLLVDVYNQKVNPDDPKDDLVVTFRKGDLFEPKNQAEADRLEKIGAAVDPKKAQQIEADRIQAERDQLEARKDALDAQLAELPKPSRAKS